MKKVLLLVLLVGSIGFAVGQQQNKNSLALFHGLERHDIQVMPYTKPPFVNLTQVLAALELPPLTRVEDSWILEINRRSLKLNEPRQQAVYNQKRLPFPLKNQNGAVFVRIDALCRVFSELLGRRMIYEPTSKSAHLPKFEPLKVSFNTQASETGYRLILAYSQAVREPLVQRAGSNLIVKFFAESALWDRVGFQPNEAVTAIEIFENLPDRSSELLLKIGPRVSKYTVEPFSPRSPRTVIHFSGQFEETLEASNQIPDRNTSAGIHRITIDPGHGGVDQGAKGPTGLMEKNVALSLAKQLERILEGSYGFEAELTRRDDTLFSLKTRTGMANHFKADLFISLHVNAIETQNATGSETYYLSLDSDIEYDDSHYGGLGLSEPEKGEPHVQEMDNDLSLMLWDMAQAKHTEDSFRVAKYIQESLNLLAGIRSRGVKQAPLKVLKGATMPAVLVEVAFISNKYEEKKLRDFDFKERIVAAIASAISQYDEDVKRRSQNYVPPLPEEGH